MNVPVDLCLSANEGLRSWLTVLFCSLLRIRISLKPHCQGSSNQRLIGKNGLWGSGSWGCSLKAGRLLCGTTDSVPIWFV